MTLRVYAIGGLGVDERVFEELSLDVELTLLKWINPEYRESIQHYALRLAKQIDTSSPFVIMGVSFGGRIALELSNIVHPQKIILISSATHRMDIPALFRLFAKTGLLRIIPDYLLKPPTFLANYFFGATKSRYQKILGEIIRDTDYVFLRWAIEIILGWRNTQKPINLFRIHGSDDRLLCSSQDDVDVMVSKGGHFMIMDRAPELSKIINRELHKIIHE